MRRNPARSATSRKNGSGDVHRSWGDALTEPLKGNPTVKKIYSTKICGNQRIRYSARGGARRKVNGGGLRESKAITSCSGAVCRAAHASIALAGIFRQQRQLAGLAVKVLGVGQRFALDGDVRPDLRHFDVELQPLLQPRLGVGLDRLGRAFGLANAESMHSSG